MVRKDKRFEGFSDVMKQLGFKRYLEHDSVAFVWSFTLDGERLVVWNCEDMGDSWRASYHRDFEDDCGHAFTDLGEMGAVLGFIVKQILDRGSLMPFVFDLAQKAEAAQKEGVAHAV